jgi:hypothetical protein
VIAEGGRQQIAESRLAIVFDTINASKVTGPSLVNSRETVWWISDLARELKSC